MMLNVHAFVARLKRVIAWTNQLSRAPCAESGNYGTVFRQTSPALDGRPLFTVDRGYTTWNVDVYELTYLKYALQVVFEQRDKQLGEAVSSYSNLRQHGRILCFETQVTTHDGVPIAESNCFVDESDMPPIDTWFFLDKPDNSTYLFCWIPKQFEAVMQRTIDAELLGSYHWFDEFGPLTYQEIIAETAT